MDLFISPPVAFKEICPAGPGYHYSASALQFNQRVSEQLGGRGAPLVTHGNQDNQATVPPWQQQLTQLRLMGIVVFRAWSNCLVAH